MHGDISTALRSAQHDGAIAENLKHIRQQIPENVKLVAVSKTKPIADLEEAYAAGQRDFGENKVQELVAKQPHLPNDIRWHFIGHMQTNKVKFIAPFVHLIHGVDSLKLLKEIDKQAQKNNRIIDCLLEFHIAEEETKFGLNLQEADQILSSTVGAGSTRPNNHLPQPQIQIKGGQTPPLQNVRICGIMGMATFTDNAEQIRREFRNLHQIFQILKEKYFADQPHFCEISMGMSDDFRIAIEEGSTMIRIGSTIFGNRKSQLQADSSLRSE
ncbi:MAG: YggS family pyridoxal phosphate-dependent enzyme [Bacteroidales bacterium]|nr:YggS family pyridoxal phosphate-dependent enzyme [Bacteroidales bacterium]